MKRWMALIPLAVLIGFGLFGAIRLIEPRKADFAVSTNRAAPELSFPRLEGEGEIRFAPPPDGEAIALNLFASWCAPCRAEHRYLMDLQESHDGRLYGLAYEDAPENTRAFLDGLGNPFAGIGVDLSGQGGLEFGLTGVPETFVIDGEGQILLHIRGPLDPGRLREVRRALDGAG